MFCDLNESELLVQFKAYLERHGEVIFKIKTEDQPVVTYGDHLNDIVVTTKKTTIFFERLPDTQDYVAYQSKETPPLLVAFKKATVIA